MQSYGDRLRREREGHGLSLGEMSGRTGIDVAFLGALERSEFEVLPGPAFGKLYIRAYAEILGFDPRPLIEDYDRERYRRLREESLRESEPDPSEAGAVRLPPAGEEGTFRTAPDESPEVSVTVRPDEEKGGAPPDREDEALEARPPEPEPEVPTSIPVEGSAGPVLPSRMTLVVAALVLLGVLAIVLWTLPERSGGEAPAAALTPGGELAMNAPDVSDETSRPDEDLAQLGRSDEVEVSPENVPAAAPADPPSPGRLSVPEYGIGRRVVGRRLEGESDRFEAGAVAWFLTRVVGGGPGERIRHVWLHEGAVVQSVELELGGPRWRTYSRRTLGGTGTWVVEARDAEDRLLARSSFTCEPAGT